jgi:hypothetical protein
MSVANSRNVSVQFALVELTEEQLSRIPTLYRALLVATAFATNETLCLTRLLILTLNSSELFSEGPLGAIATANLGAINRVLSSKVVEFLRFVDKFGQRNRTANTELSKRLFGILMELRPLRKAPAYKLAVSMRNSLSHHYSLDDFERYVEVGGYVKTRMWLGDMEGNSSYFLGEHIANIGLFAQIGDPETALGDWIDWSREASRLISKINSEIAIAVAEEFVPEIEMELHRVSVPADLFADVNTTPVPLLWYPFGAVDR